VKLPLREPELDALSAGLAQWDGYVSSRLLAVEAIRACARYGDRYERDARDFLESVSMLPLDDEVLDRAVTLRPAGLRSLDALHLATALVVRDEIGAFVTYDQQLAKAAEEHGLPAIMPS
jgi:predicted nucleic acid-binding protein